MAASKARWPIVGRKGANHDKHALHLRTEAQQLTAALKAPTQGEKRQTKRGLPNEQATKFLDSFIDWIQKEEGRTHSNPILNAIQQLEQLIVTQPDTSSQENASGG